VSQQIKIQLPDGSVREVAPGTTPLDIANSISPRLAAAVVVARVRPLSTAAPNETADAEAKAEQTEEAMYSGHDPAGERIVDLVAPLNEDVALELLKESDPAALRVVRHSAAHVMATAILELFPETKLGHGPATDNGYFYDVYREVPFTEADLAAIEQRMAEVVARDEKFQRVEEPREQGLKDYEKSGEFMKVHFIERFTKPGDTISLYKNGNFTDFCRGPHVPSTSRVKAFKVMSIAGAYWLGKEDNQQLQRIYGTAFFSQRDLDAHFKYLEEIKARDHRVIGKQLGLFHIDEEVGPGLVLWKPNGAVIRQELQTFIGAHLRRQGYDQVFTPHIGKLGLYKTSGHFPYYADSQFPPLVDREEIAKMAEEGKSCADLANRLQTGDIEGFLLKPMNCPHHIRIYASEPRSYRDLPVRLSEFGTVYRFEQSGELGGMTRVRGFTQDDAHLFCTEEQVSQEIAGCLELVKIIFGTLGMTDYRVRVGLRDPDSQKYVGETEHWDLAEKACKDAAALLGVPFTAEPGEAAFYGPKIDFVVKDVIGREWQLGTIQVDYQLPRRFDLSYTGADNKPHRPVIIHRAPFGSMERFVGVLIEHYAGAFPFWLAPVQVGLVPISEKHNDYAQSVKQRLKAAGLRVEVDLSNQKMNAKIRDFGLQKVPFILVVGDKESATDSVSVRVRGKGDQGSQTVEAFLARAKQLVTDRSAEL